jgi:hypothetical protein
MSKHGQAALAAAVFLSACGGGGGSDAPAPPPPAATTPAEALRTTAQAVMDVTELAWALSFDLQITTTTAPAETAGTRSCAQGGSNVVTRLRADLLRIEHQNCRIAGASFAGVVEADGATVSNDGVGVTSWSGTVRWTGFRADVGSSVQTVSVSATGSGSIRSAGSQQPMTMLLSGLSATRTPDALGRGATLSSAALRVERITAGIEDLYALEGCVSLTATGLVGELCIDAGSRIALVQNIGSEQLTGRLRWNAGTPGGFDARLRVSPAGAAGSSALRVELDLDSNGSFETSATLDRYTDIGFRI